MEEVESPFTADNAPGFSLMYLMRLYDVLMGIYAEMNESAAEALMDFHEKGVILLPPPTDGVVFKYFEDEAHVAQQAQHARDVFADDRED